MPGPSPIDPPTVTEPPVANDPVSSKFPKLEAGKFNPFAAFAKFDVRGEVSWTSPVARALLKARVGDSVEVRTPGGSEPLEVLRIAYQEG